MSLHDSEWQRQICTKDLDSLVSGHTSAPSAPTHWVEREKLLCNNIISFGMSKFSTLLVKNEVV